MRLPGKNYIRDNKPRIKMRFNIGFTNWRGIYGTQKQKTAGILPADGATILEPGIRKIVEKYNIDVTKIGFAENKTGIEFTLRRNTGEPYEVRVFIPREYMENNMFDAIEKLVLNAAITLADPDFEDIIAKKQMRKAVSDAVKELR